MAKPQHKPISANQLAEVGQQLYEKRLRDKLEPRHKGKIIAIEVESGDYFIGKNLNEASLKAKQKHPNNVFYFVRVGYPAVYSFASGATIST